MRFVSVYNVLNTLSEYKYFYISKKTLLYTFFWLFFKSSKAFSVFLIKQDLFLLLFLMKNFLNKSAFNMLVWLVQILVSLWQARFYNSFILFIWIFNEQLFVQLNVFFNIYYNLCLALPKSIKFIKSFITFFVKKLKQKKTFRDF